MEYQDLKSGIRNHLNDAAEDFFMVGYFLRKISENALFTEDGYKNIWDFAKGEYGLSTSSASRFMAINARFSIDGGEHMAEKYIGMGVSKLQEMLGLPNEELEKVTQETTVREIRAMKKKKEEPKSFFGLLKTVRPEGSLLSTKGCGQGKYECYSCARPCGIRQEERYCRDAPLGNPSPCTQMDGEKQLGIEAGLFSKECQFLNLENAETRKDDNEPMPCCQNCGNKTCFSRCDVAKKRDRDGRKKEQARLQKEAEAKKPDMTQEEIESLYGWLGIKPWDKITGAWLKEQHGRAYHGGGYGGDYFNCTPRGVKTDRSKEMTWAKAAEALNEAQDRKNGLAGLTIGADPQEPEEVLCDTCGHDGERAGKKTHASGCMGYEEKVQELETEAEAEPDPEEYGQLDVDLLLDKYRRDLELYHEADCPANMIKTQKILVDALGLLLGHIGQV